MDKLNVSSIVELFKFDKFGNIPNFQLDKGMPDTLKRIYPIMGCIIDCTELFCPRISSSLKVPLIQAKSIMLH